MFREHEYAVIIWHFQNFLWILNTMIIIVLIWYYWTPMIYDYDKYRIKNCLIPLIMGYATIANIIYISQYMILYFNYMYLNILYLLWNIYIYKTFKKLCLKIFLELLFVLNIPDLIIIITVFFKPTNPFLHHFWYYVKINVCFLYI